MSDTIVAIATAPGRGGIGIVRITGPEVSTIAQHIIQQLPTPRVATFTQFYAQNGTPLDEGLALYFPGPHSYTGEDTLELQGHGGPVILNEIVHTILEHGARLARPGEFTERAFLNSKLDLAQAEAVADLIDAGSAQAARSALRSLQGEFSKKIHELLKALIELRMMVEAAIDFPEEEIDFLEETDVLAKGQSLLQRFAKLLESTQQGVILREGIQVVIVGKPNVGKSSLLNRLSGHELAIVTDIAGTTRDVLREFIQIDGIPLHLVDTAGLRETADVIEQEGVRRTYQEMDKADIVIQMVDVREPVEPLSGVSAPQLIVRNKIDLLEAEHPVDKSVNTNLPEVFISAKTGAGMQDLASAIKQLVGFHPQPSQFIARARHLDALKRAQASLQNGLMALKTERAGELFAEDLRQAQQALNEITGEFTADDLLGKIFSSFCIGK